MHQARRSLRLARPGTRASSTAAKVATRSLGKWERPQPAPLPSSSEWPRTSDPSSSSSAYASPAPQSRRWERPQLAPSRPGSAPGNWARPGDRDRPPTARQVPASLPSKKWVRPGASTPSGQGDSWSQTREPAPHQSPANLHVMPGSDRRGPAPHQVAPLQRSNAPRSLGNILDKDRIKSALEVTKESEDIGEEDAAPVERRAPAPQVDIIIGEEPVLDRPRYGKALRPGEYKERGSIVHRMHFRDVTIPKYSRVHNTRPVASIHKEREKKFQTRKNAKRVNMDIFIPSIVSVGNFARLLNVRLDNLRRKMVKSGMQAEAAYDHMLTAEYASLLAMEYGRNPVVNDEAAFDIYPPSAHPEPSTLPARPPIVTIMGHVDHGKTTLLDTLRSTSVAKGEAGGITQHIGAFSVPVPANGDSAPARTITFLDTPGHAAFSAMRARGAGVTDIIVLVVAADDGIMPQTREVIELINKEKVSVVVAINKMDKPGVDVSKIETALLAEGVQLETFGGDIPSVPVSGLTGQGLDQLVETISLLAEMQDLRAAREGKIQGYVLESRVQKGLGPVATVLLLRGSLKPGDHIICGQSHAKVRVLTDSSGNNVKAAYPGMAVTVSGWKELPKAGDEALNGTEAEVKKALANRVRKAEMEATLGDVEAINEQRRLEREQRETESVEAEAAPAEKQPEGPKELRLIIKADVSGSVEAVAGALEGIGNNVARVKIIATGVGDVTESDVMRAKAADGTVVAFSVSIPRPVQADAASQQVPVLTSSIIYRLMDDVKARVIALLPPIVEKRVTGEANVLQLFDIHLPGRKVLKVAGCRVTNGVVEKNKLARVIRDGETIHEGRLETLKHHKKDIFETGKGTECGMGFEKYDDLRAGDMIQMYLEVDKPGSL